ncbi:DsbA family protein [Parvibaculum sp.]|uniref:DsbA family protein n=1 Tax=Parvibaculum sp. TaxID=2024848 RepID=UPI0034A08AFE
MRTKIATAVSALVTSPRLRALGRRRRALMRRLSGRRPVIHYFHQAGDPYSVLAVQAVPLLRARYGVDVEIHAVSAPDRAAAPEPDMLTAYGLRDAALSGRLAGFSLDADVSALAPDASAKALAKGDALRRKLGHYLGAVFYFEGEWYWGLDRLDFLEERLAPFRRADAPALSIAPRREVTLAPCKTPARPPVFEAFISFRSPYTWLAIERVTKLAAHYGADLKWRFVLPMVMRGLPVPLAKQLYIVRDCKREAERLGLPFGRVADPVGAGAERGLSVLHHAIPAGKGAGFAQSFLQGVFAEGIDAATDAGLIRLAARAGLDDAFVKKALADPSWREVAEKNRADMFAGGAWGVPSFRVEGGAMLWGQDRLWAIEEALRAACESP